jgi:hypothetical protein
MRKGLSAIVSVVFLIAIVILAAIGLYFWLGGLATKQSTASAPRTINVVLGGECGTGTSAATNFSQVTIINTSPSGSDPIAPRFDLLLAGGSGNEAINTTSGQCATSIAASSQGSCRIDGLVKGDGQLVFYGAAGRNIASATLVC